MQNREVKVAVKKNQLIKMQKQSIEFFVAIREMCIFKTWFKRGSRESKNTKNYTSPLFLKSYIQSLCQ